MNILLIDDSAAYREEFAELLVDGEFPDANLAYCTDASGGERAIREGGHDIVFVDYRLPGDSGLDLIRRARGTGFEQPMICLTGFDDPRLDREAEAAGANGYLPKGGFSAQFLSRTIRYAIRNAALVAERAAALQASEAKSRFLASMSHELRTPLSGILGYAHLLRLDGGLSAHQAARVDAMLKGGAHLLEMINRVLDLSAIEAERLDLHLSRIEPRAVMTACLDLVGPAAAAKALALQLQVEPGAPEWVLCDPTRLRQIVVNLLGNAVKFVQSGAVTVTVRGVGAAEWCVEVADTGPGINAALRSRLFEEFQRCRIATAPPVEGAGLGLAVSARLAGLLGGALGYRDNAGGGSVFTLTLPIEAASPTAVDAPATAPRGRTAAAPLRILVVDDVSLNLEIATAFLQTGHHEVTCAHSGAEAIQAIADGDFDVVLMDVRMPGMDGLETTRRVRAMGSPQAAVPIVGLTAQAYGYQVSACLAAGMNGHLSKPYDRPRFWLSWRRRRRRRHERRRAAPAGTGHGVTASPLSGPGCETAVPMRIKRNRTASAVLAGASPASSCGYGVADLL